MGKSGEKYHLTLAAILCVCFFACCTLAMMDQLNPIEKRHVQLCYDEAVKANSEIKERFEDEMIMAHCNSHMKWTRQFLDSLARSAYKAAYKPKNLTPAQFDWITELWQCKEKLCACNMIKSCKKLARIFLARARRDNVSFDGGSAGANGRDRREAEEFVRLKRQNNWQNIHDMLQDKLPKVTRKEIRIFSENERQRLFRALNRLKTEEIDGMSKYNLIIRHHTPEYAPQAHFCAAFLPFHRELMKSFELALRTVDPDLGLPYWDTTLDEPLPDPKDSILWSELFFGNGFGSVVQGPFSNWTTMNDVRLGQLSTDWKIRRNLGVAQYSGLVRQSDIDQIMAKNFYFRDFVYCVDPFFELVHGGAHLWVGGHMLELRISPNDPTFFIYHAFIDLVWEQWRQAKQSRYQRETEYVNYNDACNTICQGDQQMRPFPLKITEGLSNAYTDNMYQYDSRPTCSYQNTSCRSPYLFCDLRRYICMSKVKMQGNCDGFDGTDICYEGQCVWGRCAPLPPTAPAPTIPPTTQSTTTTTTLPSTTTRLPEPETVWIPITVLSLTEKREYGAYPPALITSVERGTGRRLTGQVADASRAPYYTGAAYAQLANPPPTGEPVQATIEVLDPATGTQCRSFCLLSSDLTYVNCKPKIKLSRNPADSDYVKYAKSSELANGFSWNGPERVPAKFMFLCNPLSIEFKDKTTLSSLATSTSLPVEPFQDRNSNCLNTHRCCPMWGVVSGQCQADSWLSRACPKSCLSCQSGTTLEQDEQCSDYNRQCPVWAGRNQCNVNANWMEENCRRSCKVCDRPKSTLSTLCGLGPTAEDRPGCRDLNANCALWSTLNECQRNPRWMLKNCPKSCKSC